MATVMDVLAGDPEMAALDQEEANIRKAQDAYRADPALAADLLATGWFRERTDAARRGEAVWSEGRAQAEPALKFAPAPGQLQVRPNAWAGFVGLIAEVSQRRAQLIERRRPEILGRLADREAELRQQALDCRVRDLDQLVDQANQLLSTVARVRGPLPRTVRTPHGLAPERYREATDAVELVDAALGGWSLLDPLDQTEPVSVITNQLGIRRDGGRTTPVEVRAQREVRYGTHRLRG